ncbi:TPA: DUF551 domain-containing protein [Escherichia coli]|nr:DUF551 domain-containing protein [Escherichia coli]
MSNLLPCPFCGGAAHVASEADHPEYGSGGRFYFVRCGTCRAQSGSKYAAPGNDCAIFYSEVRAEWNQRAKEANSECKEPGNSPVTPDGWISCSDRMPEDTKMLLAFSQGKIVAAYWNWVINPIDYKKYRAFTYLSGYILDDVTHWMPLPEPPL